MQRFRRFSIRSALVLIALIAVYLAYWTNTARQQRRDVATIRNAGGTVYYDWMLKPFYDANGNITHFLVVKDPDVIDAPKWMRSALGDEYFQQVVQVHLPVNAVDEDVVAAASNFPSLTEINLSENSPDHPPLSEPEISALRERLSKATGVQVAGPFVIEL